MYPHQVLMEDNNLTKDNLSEEGKGYLKDFNLYLNAINMKLKRAAKKGQEIEVSTNEMSKLNRLSKSVVVQIYSEMKKEIEQNEKDKIEEERVKQEAEALRIEQQEEEERIQAENEERKKQEEIAKKKEEEIAKKKEEEKQQPQSTQQPQPAQQQPQVTSEPDDSDDLMDFFF